MTASINASPILDPNPAPVSAANLEPAPPPRPSPVRDWFARTFPHGPTPAQRLAWPLIERGDHLLLTAPTGNGKTLAAFLAILDRLWSDPPPIGLRCVYLSPLRSLGYDIEKNLNEPLRAIAAATGRERPPIRIAVRTGDTAASARAKQREAPPHLLITTPESLALLLSQANWNEVWRTVEHVIVDEIHALAPTKRGADLMLSLERLAACCERDPVRIGLSATCRPASVVAEFLVGPSRVCAIAEAPPPPGSPPPEIEIEALQEPGEAVHWGLSYDRLLRRLRRAIESHRSTIIFANTRAFAEKLTHDLRPMIPDGQETIAAHHSALDAARRLEAETKLKEGRLRAAVTSTSLELGVDISSADLSVLIGLPGSVARCLQRVGRAGHRIESSTRGLILAATPAELAGAAVTVRDALAGEVEPLNYVRNPLDVLCQQLIGMASAQEWSCDEAFALVRRSSTMSGLDRADFDACLAFLAGELASPPGAYEPEPNANPRWSSPRIWKARGLFGVRNRRVARWLRSNIGTIHTEESCKVMVDDAEIGTVESSYAERLQPGDRFVLDGRALEFLRIDSLIVRAKPTASEPQLPRWSSDRQGLSAPLARKLAMFRRDARDRFNQGPQALRSWLRTEYALGGREIGWLEDLMASQERFSEIPDETTLLVEEWPESEGYAYAFHAPLGRAACEAIGRAAASRLGRRQARDLALAVADLGWLIQLTDGQRLNPGDVPRLIDPEGFAEAVLDGVDRGELPAQRFRRIAGTALMVLKRPEGGRTKVGGMLWVSKKLYPLVQASCPDHPLLRETRREVLDDLLDAPTALRWLQSQPAIRMRTLHAPSPFAIAWLNPSGAEALQFEAPADALKRLHARLMGGGPGNGG